MQLNSKNRGRRRYATCWSLAEGTALLPQELVLQENVPQPRASPWHRVSWSRGPPPPHPSPSLSDPQGLTEGPWRSLSQGWVPEPVSAISPGRRWPYQAGFLSRRIHPAEVPCALPDRQLEYPGLEQESERSLSKKKKKKTDQYS